MNLPDPSSVLTGVLRTSGQASALVVLVLAVQWVFRKQLSPKWRSLFWFLVVARLVMPATFSSTLSVFNLFPRHESPASPPIQPEPKADPRLVVPRPEVSPPTGLENASVPDSKSPVAVESKRTETANDLAREAARPQFAQPRSSPVTSPFPWSRLFFWVWLAGTIALAMHLLVMSIRMARRLGGAPLLRSSNVLALLEECQQRLALKQSVALCESSLLTTPAVYGLFQPRLILPVGFIESFSERELRFVFLHELAHIKRRDLWTNWLVAVLQSIHWFNPIIWFGFARWRTDRESACDTLALELSGANQNQEYGRTILRLLENYTAHAGGPGVAGILEDPGGLRRRIKVIATFAPSRRFPLPAIALAVLLAIVCLTDAQNNPAQKSSPAASTSTPAAATAAAVAPETRPVVTNGPIMKVTVLDAATGRPLSGAAVLAPNWASYYGGKENAPRWLTDSNGVAMVRLGESFEGHLNQRAWFTLSARFESYAPHGLSWSADNRDVRPEMPKEVTIKLERGGLAGGIVQDDKGRPVPGVRVNLFGSGRWSGLRDEYPEYWSLSATQPPLITDANGRWQVRDFPRDLTLVRIELARSNGSIKKFVQEGESDPREKGDPIQLDALRKGEAVFVLERGMDVPGVVVDPSGKPLPNVAVKWRYGSSRSATGTLRTDANGRFVLQHQPEGQVVFTASPEDHAIASVVVDVRDNMPRTEIRVTPRQPLMIRVGDANDRGIEGVQITVDTYRTQGQELDLLATTDATGTVIWTNAPNSEFALVAKRPSLPIGLMSRVKPGQKEAVFRFRDGLEKEILVTGRVVDSKNEQPVMLESVTFQTADINGFVGEADFTAEGFRLAVPSSRFRPGGMYPTFQLLLKAKGYGDLLAPWRDLWEGDWQTSFSMRPLSECSRAIVLPDGMPAIGAKVWVRPDQNSGSLNYSNGRFYGERMLSIPVDAMGRFALPSVAEDQPVMISHAQGFLESSVRQLENTLRIQLQPLARVEGVLRVGGARQPGTTVQLITLDWTVDTGIRANSWAATSLNGSFIFTNVPPGEYKLYKLARYRSGPGQAIVTDHPMPVRVEPGEVVKLAYESVGRPVIGQARPENAETAVDWLRDTHTLVLKQQILPRPNYAQFATIAGFQKAVTAYNRSPVHLQQVRDARTYVLEFEADGSFRIDDVPPGTYELNIRVTKNRGESARSSPFPRKEDELGFFTREVVVTEGTGPFDLGTLTMPMKEDVAVVKAAQKNPVVNFEAEGFNGTAVKLSEKRGKNVLVIFWAAWSSRSVEALAGVERLHAEFRDRPDLEFISVNLDDDRSSAEKLAAERGYSWPQTHLPVPVRARVTEVFDVKELPSICLVDVNGRIINRDLDGDRVRTTLRRTLRLP